MSDLDGVRQAFEGACASSSTHPIDCELRLGGLRVHLRVAGSELASLLTRAFAPLLETPGHQATDAFDLRISAWDRTATGMGCPGLALIPDRTDVLGPGLMSQYRTGRLLRYERATIVKHLDRDSRNLFLFVQDASRLGFNDRTRPIEHFLRAWAHDRALHILHAGLVAKHGRGVLLAGRGGAGKSTTAIACALGGLDFHGDDFVATAMTSNGWFGHALYDTVRMDRAGVDRFPALRPHSTPPRSARDGNKFLAYMSEAIGTTLTRPLTSPRLTAILMPTIAGTDATFVRNASGGEALRRLAPSTLLRALGGGTSTFAHLSAMVRSLPCYELVLGRSVDSVPAIVTELLERHQS